MRRSWLGWLAAVLGVVLVLAACRREPEFEQPAVGFSAHLDLPEGQQEAFVTPIEGNVVPIRFEVKGVTIVAADGDTSGKTAHFHVFIDREPPPVLLPTPPSPGPVSLVFGQPIPKEPGILHTTDNPFLVTGLSIGRHRLIPILGDGTHRRFNLGYSTLLVDVRGPSVAGTIVPPATGGGVVVELVAEGVEIRAADGDTSGKTGHFHVFVDRDPTPAGQAIPKEGGVIHTTETTVSLDGLAAGEHFIWVVLGDGAHVPLMDGNVAHRLTFTIP